MPHTPDDLFTALDKLGIETSTVEHEPVFTVEESQHLHRTTDGAHTKNLFLRDNKKSYFLVCADQARKIDLKRIRPILGAKGGLSFASPDALMAHLGVSPGSVSPFAAINDAAGAVRVFVDADLLEAEVVNCHPLTNTRTTSIRPQDLLTFLHSIGHAAEPLRFPEPEPDDQAPA